MTAVRAGPTGVVEVWECGADVYPRAERYCFYHYTECMHTVVEMSVYVYATSVSSLLSSVELAVEGVNPCALVGYLSVRANFWLT